MEDIRARISYWEKRLKAMSGGGDYLKAFQKSCVGIFPASYLKRLRETVQDLEQKAQAVQNPTSRRPEARSRGGKGMKVFSWLAIIISMTGGLMVVKSQLGWIAVAAILVVVALVLIGYAIVMAKTKVFRKGLSVAGTILAGGETAPRSGAGGTSVATKITLGLVAVLVLGFVVFLFGSQLTQTKLFQNAVSDWGIVREEKTSEEIDQTVDQNPVPMLASTAKTAKKQVATVAPTVLPSELAKQIAKVIAALSKGTRIENGKEVTVPFPPLKTSDDATSGQSFPERVAQDLVSLASKLKGTDEEEAAAASVVWWKALVDGNYDEASAKAKEMEKSLPALGNEASSPTRLTLVYSESAKKTPALVATEVAANSGSGSSPKATQPATAAASANAKVNYSSGDSSTSGATPEVTVASAAVKPTQSVAEVQLLLSSSTGQKGSWAVAYARGFKILRSKGLDAVQADLVARQLLASLTQLASEGTDLDVDGSFNNYQVASAAAATPTIVFLPTATRRPVIVAPTPSPIIRAGGTPRPTSSPQPTYGPNATLTPIVTHINTPTLGAPTPTVIHDNVAATQTYVAQLPGMAQTAEAIKTPRVAPTSTCTGSCF